jgi:hypothetical protein
MDLSLSMDTVAESVLAVAWMSEREKKASETARIIPPLVVMAGMKA